MNWFIKAVKQYATFSGRAQRAEFWYFMLFFILGSLVLSVIDQALGTGTVENGGGALSNIWGLGLLIPSVAVGARRLHDTGRSGWWQLLNLIPLIGTLILIVFWAKTGQPGRNAYGENPLALDH